MVEMVVEVSGLLAELLVLLTRLPWLPPEPVETLSGELSLLWDGRSAFTMIGTNREILIFSLEKKLKFKKRCLLSTQRSLLVY